MKNTNQQIQTPKLSINPKFRKLLPSLSNLQKENLKKDIIENGCLSPIVIQKDSNIILDGHTRYDICIKNKISYTTVSVDLQSEEDIQTWMFKNQINRRDLSTYEKISIALKMNEQFIKNAAEKRNSMLLKNKSDVNQKSDERKDSAEMNTNEYIANLCNVSHNTVAQVKKIEKYINSHKRDLLKNEEVSINQIYQEILEKERQKKLKEEEKILRKGMKRTVEAPFATKNLDKLSKKNF